MYALKFMKKNKLMNILVIIQLTVVLSAMIFIISAFQDRVSFYKPFESALSKNGKVVTFGGPLTEDYLYEQFPKEVEITNTFYVELSDEQNNLFKACSYSPNLFNNFNIRLEEGRMPKKTNDGIYECLISIDSIYGMGDTFELEEKVFGKSSIKFKVVGIISDDQRIAGYNGENVPKTNYEDFYSVYNHNHVASIDTSGEAVPQRMILTVDDAFNNENMVNFFCGPGIINYSSDDYTDKQLQDIFEKLGIQEDGVTKDYYDNSNEHITRELYNITPIALCILLLTIFTSISTNAICTMRNLHSFAVLYLCGATWKKCSTISLVFSTVISITSMALTAILMWIGKKTFLSETVVSFGGWQLLICSVVILTYMLLSVIIPIIIVSKKQPRDVLKKN